MKCSVYTVCALYTSTAIRGRGYLSNSVHVNPALNRQKTSSPKYNTDIPLLILEYIIFDAIQLSCQEMVNYAVVFRLSSAKKRERLGVRPVSFCSFSRRLLIFFRSSTVMSRKARLCSWISNPCRKKSRINFF
jgi:hypothetical protein